MTNRNVETLRQAHEAFSRRNLDETIRFVAPTAIVIDHGRNQTMNSREEFRGWLAGHLAMSSDIKIVEARYIDAGDWVTAQFRAVGIQDGPMATFPASHKPYSFDVCEVWRFNADGQAIEGHNYSDGLGLLMQLGHIQPPG
jgi:hypothetical protein